MTTQQGSFNDFHASSEAAVAQSSALRGLMALQLVMDDSQTMASQVSTMATAGENEAHAERNNLIAQAAISVTQACAQFVSAGAVVASSLYSTLSPGIKSLRSEQSGLQENLTSLENLQDKMRTTGPSAPGVEAEGEVLDPAVSERVRQMQDGDFTPASKPVSTINPNLDVDAEALAHLKGGASTTEYTSVKDDLSNQASKLSNQINTNEQQITGKTMLANNMSTLIKEGANGVSAVGQSVAQALQSRYVCSKTLNQNVLNMLQAASQVLGKIIDSANQSVTAAQSAVVQAAQLLTTAA